MYILKKSSERVSCSVVSDSLRSPWTVACHFSLFMEFSKQEYWNGQPPSPGDLPNPGIKSRSPLLQTDALPSESPEYLYIYWNGVAHSTSLTQRILWTEKPGRLHTAHGVAKSRTQLSKYHLPYFFHIYVYIYTFFFIFFSLMIYYRILNIIPCDMQYDLVVYPP